MFNFISKGEQAIVGFYKDPQNNDPRLIKVSRDINFLMHHEYNVYQSLPSWIPGFMEVKNIGEIPVCDKLFLDNEDVGTGTSHRSFIELKYVKNAKNFGDWMNLHKKNLAPIFSVMRIALARIRAAYEESGFTHYDLHSENVLVANREGKPHLQRYVYKDGTFIDVVLDQYDPVIIDYGRAYSNGLEGKPLSVDLDNTHAGIFSTKPHPTYDWLFFINSCANVLKKECKHRPFHHKFSKYSRGLNEDGWWESKCKSAMEVAQILIKNPVAVKSHIFKKYLFNCLNIFSNLVILPLEKVEDPDMNPYELFPYYYYKFINEWNNLEMYLSSSRATTLLSFLVSHLNFIRADYMKGGESRIIAVDKIAHEIGKFMDNECSETWYGRVKWSELVRCAFACSRMLEGIYACEIDRQFKNFCAQISDVDYKTLLDLIPYDPVKCESGEIIDVVNRTCRAMTPEEL